MKKISEIIMCVLLITWIIVGISNNVNRNSMDLKKCCVKTAQEVYEYEDWVIGYP